MNNPYVYDQSQPTTFREPRRHTMIDDTAVPVPSIASSARIVSLSRSVPDLIKNDPEAARVLAALKNANKDVVNAKKHLIQSAPHAELQKLSRAMYRWHMENTLPWGDLGARLIPNIKLLDYQKQMGLFINEFEKLKEEFLDDYPRAVADAQLNLTGLGDMFDESLYPSVYELDRKTGIRIEYEPIADPKHFIVQLGDQAAQQMRDQYEEVLKKRVESAYMDVFKRLRDTLENMSQMLNYAGNDKPTGFRDTLVDNVTKVVELMRTCNVTNDPDMRRITNELRVALTGVTPDTLRNNESQRLITKDKLDQIINTLPALDF